MPQGVFAILQCFGLWFSLVLIARNDSQYYFLAANPRLAAKKTIFLIRIADVA